MRERTNVLQRQISLALATTATLVPAIFISHKKAQEAHKERAKAFVLCDSLALSVFAMSQRETSRKLAWFTLNQRLDHTRVS